MATERVFDFGDDPTKIFSTEQPPDQQRSAPTVKPAVKIPEVLISSPVEYYSSPEETAETFPPVTEYGSPTEYISQSGYTSLASLPKQATPESESEESDNYGGVAILAGRNLICIPTPVRDVSGVTVVDISYNSLKMLNGIHQYERVEELILDNNRLSQLCLPPLPHLKTLSINNNNLQDLARILGNLEISVPQLTYLSMLSNPLCPNELMSGDEDDYQMYRFTVINSLKSLKFLDSRPVIPREREDSQRHIEFSGVKRPTLANFRESSTVTFKGTPLRGARTPKPDQKRFSIAKKQKVKYNGRNSEGNRFIGDSVL